jgi:hypothetical protein
MPKLKSYLHICLTAALLVGCQQSLSQGNNGAAKINASAQWFSENNGDIPLENMSRRKWDNAVIADLDQDGYDDLILTDHGYTVKLYWNNAGKFAKGYDLIVGDMHGIGVADYNKDGDMDILVSRGGGSGSNARNSKLFHISKDRKISEGADFNPPLTNIRGRTGKFFDGDNDGDLDLLLLGFPSNNSPSVSENFIYENAGQYNLLQVGNLPKTYRDGQKILITDFNNDFIDDVLIYGEGKLKVMQGQGKLGFVDVTKTVLEQDIEFATGIAPIDYDNDGDVDLYISRGQEFAAGDTFFDAQKQTFAFYTKRGDFKFDDLLMGDVFEMENFQAAYPHQDVFIGEGAYLYEYPGEHHGGQTIRIVSSLALGLPDKLDKPGVYIGYIGNDTWRIAGNTNPPTSGVIHRVKNYQATQFTAAPEDILLENTGGRFKQANATANLKVNEHTSGVAVADFDNNGFQDLFVVKRGDLSKPTSQLLFLNQGQGQFKQELQHSIYSPELGAIGAGADAFDYNLDGKMDLIYANERGLWHLYKNDANNNNHFIKLMIKSSPTNKASALGAMVTISACQQSQTQRVGATAAPYTQTFSQLVHFGLGQCQSVENVTVRWSDGEVSSATDLSVDVMHKLGD